MTSKVQGLQPKVFFRSKPNESMGCNERHTSEGMFQNSSRYKKSQSWGGGPISLVFARPPTIGKFRLQIWKTRNGFGTDRNGGFKSVHSGPSFSTWLKLHLHLPSAFEWQEVLNWLAPPPSLFLGFNWPLDEAVSSGAFVCGFGIFSCFPLSRSTDCVFIN